MEVGSIPEVGGGHMNSGVSLLAGKGIIIPEKGAHYILICEKIGAMCPFAPLFLSPLFQGCREFVHNIIIF